MDALEQLLDSRSEDRIALIEPGGNHGDRLIYEGLEKKLDEFGIEYYSALRNIPRNSEGTTSKSMKRYIWETFKRAMPDATPSPGDLVSERIPGTDSPSPDINISDGTDMILIQGSGGFTTWGQTTTLFQQILSNHDLPIVVAPQTFWFIRKNVSSLVADADQPIWLYCREGYSHSLLNQVTFPDNVNVALSPDTAFYLDRNYLTEHIDESLLDNRRNGFELVNFRDAHWSIVEESIRDEVIDSCDNPFTEDIGDRNSFSFQEFITRISAAEEIYTDRMHVSILGAILDKKIDLFEHIFYKSRGVYKYNLSNYDKVRFRDAVR